MTDATEERSLAEIERENIEITTRLMSVGADTNSVQLKARLDALTDLVDDLFAKTFHQLGEEYEQDGFANEINGRYSLRLNGYLQEADAAVRKMMLQQGISESAGKLTVVR